MGCTFLSQVYEWVTGFVGAGNVSEGLHHCLGTNRAWRPPGPNDY